MKNITLSIDEQVLATVRKYAAERNISVNQLVRDYLASIAERNNRAQQVRLAMRQLSDQSDARIGAKSWTRDELHDR